MELSGGAIAGIVLGGIAAMAALCVLLLISIRAVRRKQAGTLASQQILRSVDSSKVTDGRGVHATKGSTSVESVEMLEKNLGVNSDMVGIAIDVSDDVRSL